VRSILAANARSSSTGQ